MRDAMANDQDGKAAGKKKVAEKLTQFTQGKTTYRGELRTQASSLIATLYHVGSLGC